MRLSIPLVMYVVMTFLTFMYIGNLAMFAGVIFYFIGLGAGFGIWGYDVVEQEDD